MRRLRFTAALQAAIDMEFGEAAKARRAGLHERTRPTRACACTPSR